MHGSVSLMLFVKTKGIRTIARMPRAASGHSGQRGDPPPLRSLHSLRGGGSPRHSTNNRISSSAGSRVSHVSESAQTVCESRDQSRVIQVAVNRPIRGFLDYLVPEDLTLPAPGSLVQVPLGATRTLALCTRHKQRADPGIALKSIEGILGDRPALSPDLIALLLWAADYYHHPVGEVLFGALPPGIRQGNSAREQAPEPRFQVRLDDGLLQLLKAAPRQSAAAKCLESFDFVTRTQLRELGVEARIESALLEKGILGPRSIEPEDWHPEAAHPANDEQARALARIRQGRGFEVFLLMGVTGSGKTEVYLQAIADVVAKGRQALVLVPEIGLTPQSVARFERRFQQVAVSHSDLSNRSRAHAWATCESGKAQVLIGTRSAIFTPFKDLGLIVVDEEHDSSYKQGSGFLYSARDFAVKRAQSLGIPLLLGSATPALESIANARNGRYSLLKLSKRTAGARMPAMKVVDVRGESPARQRAGIGKSLMRGIREHLSRGRQVLLFINRRGFAPVVQCAACGWKAECPACELPMTLHQVPECLRCHHCGRRSKSLDVCPQCSGSDLRSFGVGTQRVAEFLTTRFPDIPVVRIDRDAVRGRHIAAKLLEIPPGRPAILVGTQMLAKGHHFPDITLVGVLGADAGFVSPDFRAPEHTAQIILQVSGRAGRAEAPGEVLIQTLHPDHAGLRLLVDQGYAAFAESLLKERRAAGLPPFGRLALLRAEGPNAERAKNWLEELARIASTTRSTEVLGPMPAPIAKRANRYRFSCVMLAETRGALHAALAHLEANLPTRRASGVRWSIDVDPLDSL